MPVPFTTNVSHANGTGTTLTWSHVSDGNPLYLIVSGYSIATIPVFTATFNGVAMGFLNSMSILENGGTLFYVFALASPGPVTGNIVVTPDISRSLSAGAFNVAGGPAVPVIHVPCGTSMLSGDSRTLVGLDVPAFGTNCLAIAMTTSHRNSNVFTPIAGQTALWAENSVGGTNIKSAAATKTGGALANISWTNSGTGENATYGLAIPDGSLPVAGGSWQLWMDKNLLAELEPGTQQASFPQRVSQGLLTFAGGRVKILVNGTLRSVNVRLNAAPGSGQSYTFTIFRNGIATGLTFTISDTATLGSIRANLIVYAHDDLRMQCVGTTSAALSLFDCCSEFETAESGAAVYGSGFDFPSPAGPVAGTPDFTGLLYPFQGNWSTTVSYRENVLAVPGTLTEYMAIYQTELGVGNSYELYVFKNGVRQDGTGGTVDTKITLTGTGYASSALLESSTRQNKKFSLHFGAGDTVYVSSTPIADSGGFRMRMACKFIADIPGQFNVGGGEVSALAGVFNQAATVYSSIVSDNNTATTPESSRSLRIGSLTKRSYVTALWMKLGSSPGAGNSYKFTVRQNGGAPPGGPSFSISDASTTGHAVSTFAIAGGDTLDFEIVPTSFPDIATRAMWGLGMFVSDVDTTLPIPIITPAATPAGCTPQSSISNGGKGHFGCNTGGFGIVSVFPPDSGDGAAAVHADPIAGESLVGKTVVDIWVEIDVISYPSGTMTTYRRSLVDLGDSNMYFGGLKSEGLVAVGDLEHGLGNESGAFEASSVDLLFSDTIDRLFRTLLTDQDLDGNEVRVYAASPAARLAGTAPRLLFRGVLQQTTLDEPLAAKLTAVDILFADGGPFGPQRQWPPLIPADVFTSSPPDSLTEPMPWLYGEKSDEGAVDPVSNKQISKGLCPLIYVGQETISRSVTISTPAVPGAPGATYPFNGQDGRRVLRNAASVTIAGSTWGSPTPFPAFAVAAVYADGMTDAIMYDNTLRFPGQSPSVGPPYNERVVWDLWPGVPIPLGFLVFMFDESSPWTPISNPFAPSAPQDIRYKFVLPVVTNPAGPPDVPGDTTNADEPWAYSVDWTGMEDGDPWPPVGTPGVPGTSHTEIVDEIWDAYMLMGHPVYKIIQMYGSDLGNGDPAATHDRVAINPDTRADILVPGSVLWPFATSYVPYIGADGTTYWPTMIFAKGPLSDDHKNGVVNMTANVIGREDVGDGTGHPIMTAHDAEQCWLENDIINYWTSGFLATAGTFPAWADGTAKVRSSRFLARQAYTVAKLGGRGLGVSWYVDTQDSPVNFVAEWNASTETKVGVNGFGQLTLGFIDPTLDPTTLPAVDHVVDIFGPTMSIFGDQRENMVIGTCDWDPDASIFRGAIQKFQSTIGFIKYKNRWKKGNPLNSRILGDDTQLAWIMQQRLARLQLGEVTFEAPGPLGFLDVDVDTSGVSLTTIEGRGASGYQLAPMQLRRRKLSFDSRLVTYSLLDLSDVLIATLYPGGLSRIMISTDTHGVAPISTDNPTLAPLSL